MNYSLESYTLKTRFGNMEIQPDGLDTLTVTLPQANNIRIHGVHYSGCFNLQRYPDGRWNWAEHHGKPQRYYALHVYRVADYKGMAITHGATSAIEREIVPAAAAWADAHPDDFKRARIVILHRLVTDMREAKTDHAAALTQLEKDISTKLREIETLRKELEQ